MTSFLDKLEQSLASKSSNESFHSSHSHQDPFPTLSDSANPGPHAAALKAAGLPIFDIDAYLNDPRNREASPPAKSPAHKKQKINENSSSSASCTPVQLGAPRTSQYVAALHHLCQEKGLVATYEIDGDQTEGFTGMVTIGGQTIASEQHWRIKKEAKEGLAELGLPVVKEMEAVGRGKGDNGQDKNWVGLLLEYHNATDPLHTQPGPVYTEYSLGLHPLQFAATCTIPSFPSPFGSAEVPFPSKKAAIKNAAKGAVQHLISIGELDTNGSPKVSRKIKAGNGAPTVRVEAKGLEVKRDATYAARVNDLAPLLSLPPPLYRLYPASPAAPNLLSGAAHFTGMDAAYHPLLKEPVGEVRNVFGKKNAKEESARGVWEVLRKVAKERGVDVEEVDEE
ncbi:MAG: hypothetical protein Q9184_001299 [Pyrenodesmia sp. 2 TL-2023]